jgi:hypothetical protein
MERWGARADDEMTFTLAVEILKFLDATKVPDDMTVGELRALLEHARGQASMCHNCRKPITEDGPGGTWVHADGSRGCRAASFNPDSPAGESAWDDSIPRSWNAAPSR